MRGSGKTKFTITITISIIIICIFILLLTYINRYYDLLNKVSYDLPLKIDKDMMTDEELQIYNKYSSLIIKGGEKNIEKLNDLFHIDKNNILFKVHTNKDGYRYDEDAVVICEITNIGKATIIIFPLYVTKLSNVYAFGQNKKIDYELTFDLTKQTYLKILEPGNTYQSEFTVRNETLGKHIISVSFSIPRIVSLEKGNLSFDYEVIDLVDVSYDVTEIDN